MAEILVVQFEQFEFEAISNFLSNMDGEGTGTARPPPVCKGLGFMDRFFS